ncbi:MAG: heterodisulfide reductase [Desulfobacterales bacterium]|nr:heterodisulfide reductase [Desulfobacterales bacterium]
MSQEILNPNYHLLDQIEASGPFQAGACFQCRKCTNGCPVTFAMDLFPDEVIRMVLLGQRETALNCRTIWVCAACETCTTRCPNEVKIAELMDCLKEMAVQEGIPSPQPQISTLHATFLRNVQKWGRLYETTLVPAYLSQSGNLLEKWKAGTLRYEIQLGLKMFAKGRFPLFPKPIKGKREVHQILAQRKQNK